MTQQRVQAFLEALVAVCREHDLSLGHEDQHGAFLVWPYNADTEAWLLAARDDRRTS